MVGGIGAWRLSETHPTTRCLVAILRTDFTLNRWLASRGLQPSRAVDMSNGQEKTCLVIPCHNEAARLDMDRFLAGPESSLLLFVNDGSTDRTADVVRKHLGVRIHLLDLPHNRGKAEAVRSGMLHAVRTPPLSEAAWFGYWDADLATPLSEVRSLLRFSRQLDDRADSIWGSRVYRLGSVIERKFLSPSGGPMFCDDGGPDAEHPEATTPNAGRNCSGARSSLPRSPLRSCLGGSSTSNSCSGSGMQSLWSVRSGNGGTSPASDPGSPRWRSGSSRTCSESGRDMAG